MLAIILYLWSIFYFVKQVIKSRLLFFKLDFIFFRTVLGSQQNCVEAVEVSCISLFPNINTDPSTLNILHQSGIFCYSQWICTDIIFTQTPQLTLGFTLGLMHSVGFDKCIMTFIHHYRSIHSFTAPNICALSPHQPLANTNPLTVSIARPFPECHILAVHIACTLFRLASFTQ